VTATALMMLVEEGKINLDDKLTKYFPEANFQPVIQWFELGGELKVPAHASSSELLAQLKKIQGLFEHLSALEVSPKDDSAIVSSAAEFILEGLWAHKRISRSEERGYFADPAATTVAFDIEGWLDTGDLGVVHEGELYITGRAKEIIVINGQNYYPYDLENIAQRVPGLELGKVVVAGVRKPGAQSEELVVFVLHRGPMAEIVSTAQAVSRLVNEHTGLEVAKVIPIKRIPKTTSGKVRRHVLEQAHINGDFDAELAELKNLIVARDRGSSPVGFELEARLQTLCETALPGRRVDVDDNLFEIGASSLKLIEIHENISRDFPGLIDLTEMFDHPTIAKLAKQIERKIMAHARGHEAQVAI